MQAEKQADPYPQELPVSGQPYASGGNCGKPVTSSYNSVYSCDSYEEYEEYKSQHAKFFGYLQIVLGSVITVTQIYVTALQAPGFWVATGFWASPIFIIAGIFGVRSSREKSRYAVIATFVLSIISAICAFFGVMPQSLMGIILRNRLSESAQVKALVSFSVMFIAGVSESLIAFLAAVIAAACYYKDRNQANSGVAGHGNTAEGGIQMNPVASPQPNDTESHPQEVKQFGNSPSPE